MIVGSARKGRFFKRHRSWCMVEKLIVSINLSDDRNIAMIEMANRASLECFLDRCQARFNRKAMLDPVQPDATV